MNRAPGFTLVEVMITLAIAIILLSLAAPAFQEFLQNNRITSQANDLVSALQLARAEAIRRGSRASVCSSTNGSTCTGSGDWATGWIVFSDASGSAGVRDGSDTVIRVWEELSGDSTLSGSATNARYTATGYRESSATLTFTLTRPNCTGEQIRTITVNPQGRPRVQTASCP